MTTDNFFFFCKTG